MACNLKTTNLLDCALIGVCAVIRLNMVTAMIQSKNSVTKQPCCFVCLNWSFTAKVMSCCGQLVLPNHTVTGQAKSSKWLTSTCAHSFAKH